MSTFEFSKAMFFHEEICLFSDPGEFSLLCLFDSIGLMIDFGDSSVDRCEIASADMLNLVKLIHASQVLLRLVRNRTAFGARELMLGPVCLLAFYVAIVSLFASCALQEVVVGCIASTADLRGGLVRFHLFKFDYDFDYKINNSLFYEIIENRIIWKLRLLYLLQMQIDHRGLS